MAKIIIQDTSGVIKPKIEVADTGQHGVDIPGGYEQSAIGLSGGGQNNSPFIVNLVNNCDGNGADERAVTMRLWSRGNEAGGSDNGIEGFAANGPFANPTQTKVGDKLLKLAGFGYATNGFAQNDSSVINLNADQDFSNTGTTPGYQNTKSGGSISFETCDLDGNEQKVRAIVDAKGNFALGEFPHGGNNFPCSKALILQDTGSSPSGINGAGQLQSVSGQPYWHDHSNPHQLIPYKVQWNASGSIVRSFGISGIVKNGTGDFTIIFSNPYADADCFVPMVFGQGRYAYAGRAADRVRIQSFDSFGNFKDFDVNYAVIHG